MKKIVGILIVILLGVCLLKPKEKEKLDNVILKQEVNNKTFAMYKEEGDSYVPVVDTKFPEGYALNVTKSNCIDNNGNEIKDALSYENGEVTITSGKTIYCYLYFDKTLGVEIKEKEPKGLKTDAIRGAMYRFQGQAKDDDGNELVNNYICFGTSDSEICTKNPDKYMYRIIGIEAETGRVKVIKKEALDESMAWADNDQENIEFPDSKIYKAISGNNFLENSEYVPDGWIDKISHNTWTYGKMMNATESGALQLGVGLFEIESGHKSTIWYVKLTLEDGKVSYKEESGNWSNKVKSKVSLMYLHDYSYSVGDDAKCNFYYGETEYAKCKLGWMHLSNNDSDAPSSSEWTMSQQGWSTSDIAYTVFYVNDISYIRSTILTSKLSVRPVFYINASEELLSGIGTLEDPFLIANN